MTISPVGWVSTLAFGSSFLSRQAARLRRVQGVAAFLWIVYGAAAGDVPLVMANFILIVPVLHLAFSRRPAWAEEWSARIKRQSTQNGLVRLIEEG